MAKKNEVISRPMLTTAWIVTAIVVLLSIQPAFNLLSSGQIMNTSYDPLDLVNTYGAFGTVGQERLNVIFEGTMNENPNDSTQWKPYVYRGLPVYLDKRPPQIAPYQLHLDWQMWFASMSSPEEYPWVYNLVWKLLHNDPNTVNLFASNPFPGKPPRFVRAVLYRYSFAKPGNPKERWWHHERMGNWLPAMSVSDSSLVDFLRSEQWIH